MLDVFLYHSFSTSLKGAISLNELVAILSKLASQQVPRVSLSSLIYS